MNYKSVTWQTATAGTPVALTEVTEIDETNGEEIIPWMADGNIFPTILIRASASRGLKITGADAATFLGIPRGTLLTIVAVLYDAVNKSGTGALTQTWTPCMVVDVPVSGQTNKVAAASISFICGSTDGVTDPLTNAQAS